MLGIKERGQSSAGGAFLWISNSQERGRLARPPLSRPCTLSAKQQANSIFNGRRKANG